ncbi:ABC-type Na+ efflux pump permease subunit [Streptomyces sp. LBL]|uniref:ABC transporter permease n=1 Tax=Streptomyces sp. LBL TaxID=2940562 RepID=UPI0024730EE6|nr:ABC transporter permease [Streptomyces sp. LBL]MDH6623230.1 ABC-type Na+ efflux pump permease subunit [Streptomyces sp. LBL]
MPGAAAPSNSPETSDPGPLRVTRELLRFSWRLYLAEETPQVLLLSKIPRAVLQAVFYTLLVGLQPAADLDVTAARETAFTGVSAFVMCLSTVVGASGVQPLDRDERTLAPLLVGRVPVPRVLLARCLPYAAEGLLLSLVTVILAGLVLTGPATVAQLLACTGVYTVMALTSLCAGAAVGALALLGRSELLYGNAALYLILVLSGAVPAPALPGWTGTVAGLLPLTHGIEALHRSLDGEPVAGQLLAELGVGALWLAAVAGLVRLWSARTRRHGHADGG